MVLQAGVRSTCTDRNVDAIHCIPPSTNPPTPRASVVRRQCSHEGKTVTAQSKRIDLSVNAENHEAAWLPFPWTQRRQQNGRVKQSLRRAPHVNYVLQGLMACDTITTRPATRGVMIKSHTQARIVGTLNHVCAGLNNFTTPKTDSTTRGYLWLG